MHPYFYRSQEWLVEANGFLTKHHPDPDKRDSSGAEALREVAVDDLANILLKAEDLLSRLVELYRSRETGETSLGSARQFWWRPTATASTYADVDNVFFELLRLSRLVRCETQRKVAIQSPTVEVCQGVCQICALQC